MGISEHRMSLELGKSKGYIQGISSGKHLPSLEELLYICEYFGVEPKDFFDPEPTATALNARLNALGRKLPPHDLELMILLGERLLGDAE